MNGPLADRFKAGFRRHAAGVALVVGETPDGPVGVTVSSLSSASAEPPLLSFSLARMSSAGPRLVGCDALAVFVLAATRADLAAAYADREAERFTPGQGWVREGGRLVLPDAVATFRGRPGHVIEAGGSWVVLLEVERVDLGAAAPPLVHHDRAYWVPAELPRTRALRAAEG